MMIKFAVIGDPISHSLSPAMQNAGLKALGMDAEYFAQHVKLDELKDFTETARRGLAGFNITVPHKNAVIPFLDGISKEARVAGSVNTVTVENGRLYGDTTDGYGLEQALFEAFRFRVSGEKIAFIGCGGAAHAAAVWFASRGASELFLMNRTLETAEALAEKIRREYGTAVRTCALTDAEGIRESLNASATAIQCTSLGLKAEDPAPFDLSLLPDTLQVYDTIYKKTPIIRECVRRKIRNANGLGMLLHQGAKSLELWTRRPAPVEAMRAALEKAYAGKE